MSGVQSPQEKTGVRVGAQAEAPFVPEAASAAERAAGWKNPPSRMQLMLWSGSKRHVFVGMFGISLLATIPWVLLTSGKKHDSHADYMDRAEGARRSRLSTSSAAVAPLHHRNFLPTKYTEKCLSLSVLLTFENIHEANAFLFLLEKPFYKRSSECVAEKCNLLESEIKLSCE